QMGSEEGHFTFQSVVRNISNKMVARHPHVFGEESRDKSAEQQTADWEAIKASERAGKKQQGALDGVAVGLPALLRAYKLQKRAARVGFDWDTPAPVVGKVREELEEVEAEIESGDRQRLEDELGDLLFCCVNLARKLDIDPESALRGGNAKFERRFRRMEALMQTDNKGFNTMPVDDVLDIYWTQAKREEC
ncbi:MAG: nucleoside triphosphate pyrophosphohydrolase, partial [Alphaproteobacteria bacterium]|nr:nucleoside triphosphate pyrophosphohydrolase [Alphaproteobacteria bacterium]